MGFYLFDHPPPSLCCNQTLSTCRLWTLSFSLSSQLITILSISILSLSVSFYFTFTRNPTKYNRKNKKVRSKIFPLIQKKLFVILFRRAEEHYKTTHRDVGIGLSLETRTKCSTHHLTTATIIFFFLFLRFFARLFLLHSL